VFLKEHIGKRPVEQPWVSTPDPGCDDSNRVFRPEHSAKKINAGREGCSSVPFGTLDAFCTQIHFMHNTSSLLLKYEAHYAAG
jgi:hypothetical protein